MLSNETHDADPQWYKDAIIYEVHVKAFFDTAQDGIGDFHGLREKLPYLRELGVTAIWLLPFYPSPLKDDGYDISDYYDVHSLYGKLRDFKEFLSEAHKHGLRVITELVLNHTSDQHAWFQESRRAEPGSKRKDFYVWRDSPDGYKEARIIFKDFETSNWAYDPVAKAYYWHRFYFHQPDLNYDNPQTERAMFDVVDFWLKMGVDGLRLDAVPYLYEREGTNCENLPETHAFLKRLRAHIDSKFNDRMLLAEANQWPSDAASYFGKSDECHLAFHFPLMPRMFMAIQMEDRFPIVDIFEQTPEIPKDCQWALFLRNHDELTLEMVTDEERDYMYRVYAQDRQSRINLGIRRRLAPLLGNDRRKIELMNVMLFTLPGTPVIYYGDEIGMGDNFYLGDRNGVRTPMQWTSDLNSGFSRANPQKLYLPVIIEPQYHFQTVNVENQERDSSSLLWWMKRLISIRKHFKAFGRGSIELLFPDNPKILSFVRSYNDETILVAINLSRQVQATDIDLSAYDGYLPRDVFSGVLFPPIGKGNYRLTFSSFGYFVFILRKKAEQQDVPMLEIRQIEVKKIQDVFTGRAREILESELLPEFLRRSRWFGGKARNIEQLKINDLSRIESAESQTYFAAMVDVHYTDGLPEMYFVPMAYKKAEDSKIPGESDSSSVIARINLDVKENGVLVDAIADPDFQSTLLKILLKRSHAKGELGELRSEPRNHQLRSLSAGLPQELSPRLVGSEQSNNSIVFGDRFILKMFRRLEEGVNPEVEIGDLLTKSSFTSIPALHSVLEYIREESEPITVAVLERFMRNQGDGWDLFTHQFADFIEKVPTIKSPEVILESIGKSKILDLANAKIPENAIEVVGIAIVENARLLGKRTAEFHLALEKERENPDFRPEPFGQFYQNSICQSMTSYANRVFQLASRSDITDPEIRREIEDFVVHEGDLLKRFQVLRQVPIESVRTRIHGDYHLKQVLFTGKDFLIIDYEGEPARSLSERRIKKSPLRDVAGMTRSFHYAAYSTLLSLQSVGKITNLVAAERWADFWYKVISAAFLGSYLEVTRLTDIVPEDRNSLRILVEAYMIEKGVYELAYELNNRPSWVRIPLRGIRDLLGEDGDALKSELASSE